MKLLEENLGSKHQNIGLCDYFLDLTPNAGAPLGENICKSYNQNIEKTHTA